MKREVTGIEYRQRRFVSRTKEGLVVVLSLNEAHVKLR